MEKSYYCERLESTLNFMPDRVNFCCAWGEGPGYKIEDYNQVLNKKDILKRQKYFIDMLAQGIIPKECKGCIEYKEKVPSPKLNIFQNIFKKKKPFNYIIVNHFKNCDCNCVYCSQKLLWKDTKNNYKLSNVIKSLYKNNMIDKENIKVDFQGGNVSCLEEFDDIVNELINNNCKNVKILTNGIKYLDSFDKFENKGNIAFGISLDCGTRETFLKIKQVDAFDIVIENIKKLMQHNYIMFMKYIIVKGINDNIEELKKFIDIVSELNINFFDIDIDYRDILHIVDRDEFIIPQHYYNIINEAEKYSASKGIEMNICDYVKQILKEGKA